MDFTLLYKMIGAAIIFIIIASLLLWNVEKKEAAGTIIFFLLSATLTILLWFWGIGYSPFSDPGDMKDGLVAKVIKVPPDVAFFVKTPAGRTFLISHHKNASTPKPGDEVIFTGESYRIIPPKEK